MIIGHSQYCLRKLRKKKKKNYTINTNNIEKINDSRKKDKQVIYLQRNKLILVLIRLNGRLYKL